MCWTPTVWSGTTTWSKHDDQFLAEADPSESLLRLNSRLPSKMPRVGPCCSASSKTTRISQLSFPHGTQDPQSTECTSILPAPKSVPTVVLIREALSRQVVFRWPLILHYGPCWQTSADCMTQARLDQATVRATTFCSWHQPPDQSLNYSPPRFRCGEPLARTPFLLTTRQRSNSHSVVLEDTSKSTVTLELLPSCWVNRLLWKKTRLRFQNRHHAC